VKFPPVKEQMEYLLRGVAEVVSVEELERKLTESYRTGRPLRVKLGIDPTARELTLGHTVPLRKLKAFQELGHQAVLIIGDYTAMVGDPTGRNEARPQLSHEETRANAATYVEQAAKVGLDISRTEIRYNSEWLAPMTFADVVRLASKMTVARMLEREDFSKRYAEGRPIFIHEFFYPLMQGTDSVAVRADVELGGIDQKFNLLVGRDLQRDAGQDPQVCLMTPIIEGIDGVEKMSKSLGNYIGLSHPPEEMYGRTMAIPDHLIIRYFVHFTEVPMERIREMEAAMAAGANPRDFKMALAREIVRLYHGEEAARAAEEHFRTVFQRREIPEDLPEVTLAPGNYPLVRLLVEAGLAPSNSEARRLIQQGGVAVDGEKATDPLAEVQVRDGMVLRAGKRRFCRVRVAP